MAKFYGQIGFVKTEEEADTGLTLPVITERDYYGDVNRVVRRWEAGQKINDDININNEISILSDPYVTENIPWIKYVRWNNAVWKVTTVEVQYPRLILSIGGVYNGEQAQSAEDP
jgi:hypothetical protein